MIKYLFIIVNSLAVFLYSLFSGDNGVTVTSTIPATMKAGQETTIELKITKGAMSGFAKLTMELPDGLAAKESENKGANYTFSKGVAKWVWASLPPENEIVIKVTLISSAEAVGAKSISAKFSFVENNAKQVVEMTPAEVNIQPADGTEAAPTTVPVATENPPAATPENTPAAVATTTPETPAVTPPASTSNNEPPGSVSVVRTLTKVNENEYLVRLEIKKGSTKGFARYSDDLPEGLNIKPLKTDGSSFSIGDGKLKFVWVAVPDKEKLELEYTMSANTSMQAVLNGEYSYLEDSQSKKQIVTSEAVSLSGQAAVPSEPVTITEKENKTTEAPPASKTETTENNMRESMAKKEGDVNYHVQIGAFTNAKVNADRLKKVFHVTESISSEMQGGFSKFMVGSHGEYKGARDHREVMKNNNGIKSAFVVAYNGSKRITVQEALMITSQKWFK
jgi:cell division septation protein DedD